VLVIHGKDAADGDVLAAGVTAVLSPQETVDDLLTAIRRAVAASPATEMARRLA